MDILAETLWHLWDCAKMTMCQNFPVPNSLMLSKNPCAENSPWSDVLVPKRPQGWNMHVPKCLLPKWWEAGFKGRDTKLVTFWQIDITALLFLSIPFHFFFQR
jgi:hypothetical protein